MNRAPHPAPPPAELLSRIARLEIIEEILDAHVE